MSLVGWWSRWVFLVTFYAAVFYVEGPHLSSKWVHFHVLQSHIYVFFGTNIKVCGHLASFLRQVEGRFHGQESYCQPHHSVLSTSPLSLGILRSFHIII